MPWYPSAKACPAAIKPTVQCFFPTLYQVLLFDFSSFGEKLFFCLRGYRRAIARSAVQKQPERERGCSSGSPGRRTGGEWVEEATWPYCWGSSKPRTTANKLSPRRAKLALNVRIGCSCRAHNHHKFSHRILQPHTKRRASHAD